MTWLNRSLKNQTMFLTTGIGVMMAISIIWSAASFNATTEHISKTSLQQLQLATDTATMQADFKRMVQEWKNVLLRGHNPSDRMKYWSRIAPLAEQLNDEAKKIANQVPLGIRTKLEEFTGELEKLLQGYRMAYAEFEKTLDHKAADRLVRGMDRAAEKLLEEAIALIERNQKAHNKAVLEASQAKSRTVIIAVVAVLIIMIIVFTMVVMRKVVQPLTELSHFSEHIAQGEFEHNLNIHRDDEVGKLADVLRRMANFLASTYQQLNQANQELLTLSEKQIELANSFKGIAEQQFSKADQVATAVTEMSASAQEVASAAKRAAEATSRANQSAKSGHDIMRKTITTIEQVAATIDQTSEVIQKLEQDASAVSTVLEVIRGIAEQTNLLALNAAIEAARAGEQGRGFAVVADEVRTLAQRTQESTQEIQQILETVQSGALNAVRAIASAKSASFDGVAQVEEAGGKIEDITHGIDTISQMNDQIATAAYEQSKVSEDLSKNINEISQIAGDNVTLSEEVKDTSELLRQVSEKLTDIVKRITSRQRA
jgi:methyl-accepting chemotaxis protein